MFGALLVAVGWMVTNHREITDAIRDRSIAQVAYYEQGSKARALVLKQYLPDPKAVLQPPGTGDKYSFPVDSPVYEAMDDELNILETIASGVFAEIYDETLIRQSLGDNVMNDYELAEPYIKYTQETYGSDIWEDFCRLREKWANSENDSRSDYG